MTQHVLLTCRTYRLQRIRSSRSQTVLLLQCTQQKVQNRLQRFRIRVNPIAQLTQDVDRRVSDCYVAVGGEVQYRLHYLRDDLTFLAVRKTKRKRKRKKNALRSEQTPIGWMVAVRPG